GRPGPRSRRPATRLDALLSAGREFGPGAHGRDALRRTGDGRGRRRPVHHRSGRGESVAVLIVMRHGATEAEVRRVIAVIEEMGYKARPVKDAGAVILRGGAWKPRTSPYAFQGLGRPGLKLLAKAREETGLLICTEAMDPDGIGYVAEVADLIQIGARNMQNFSLLKIAGRAKKPVLLKRGMSATIEELLLSAEYLLAEGNHDVILCERGIRGFDTAT